MRSSSATSRSDARRTARKREAPALDSVDRAKVSPMIRRVGAETGVPASAYDRLERCVATVIRSFDEAPPMQHAA
jgi:hypothetical protein